MRFKYTGIREGKEVHEEAEATDKFALSRSLKDSDVVVLTAEAVDTKKDALFAKVNKIFSSVSFKEKIFFISNLSEMLGAGLSLSRALRVSFKQTRNQKLKQIVTEINTEVDHGGSFAGTLAHFPKIFPPTTVAMVEAGEKSGRVPEALKIVSTQMMKLYQLKKRIRGALMYPAIVITAMLGIGVMMLVYIVPTLASTFKELGAELPLTTRAIIGFSEFLTQHYLIVIGIVLLVVFLSWRVSHFSKTKRAWAWFVLHLPIIGNVVRHSNSAITARTLSSLLVSGVDIVAALTITERVLGNPYYQDILAKEELSVPKGQSLSQIFGDIMAEKIYPPFVGEMMSVGEETGKLPEMLHKLAEFYEGEVDAVVKDLSTVIEPLIMLIVGAGVGFFALSMIQPIYEVGNSL